MAEDEETEDAPLPSGEAAEASEPEPEPERPARPPPPRIKLSTMVLIFLGLLGFIMLVDMPTRVAVASLIGLVFNPLIGFQGQFILLTMFCAGAIEMAITAVGYNYTTDWVKAAKVQSWSSAFRKVQMQALRSGKKDRIDALKGHQQELQKLSGEMSMAQLKGMAVTWFLVIAIYSWVGLEINSLPTALHTISMGGWQVNLTQSVLGAGLIPVWFILFSVYTVPMSFIFRRLLKNWKLRRMASQSPPAAGSPA